MPSLPFEDRKGFAYFLLTRSYPVSLKIGALLLTSLLWISGVAAFGGDEATISRVRIDFSYVEEEARKLAAKPYDAEQYHKIPESLSSLNFDQYRAIKFRPEKTLWLPDNGNFRLQFFHPGYIFDIPVQVHEFSETHRQHIRFVESFFDYTDLAIEGNIPVSVGYAGLKVLYPLDPNLKRWDETLTFLGSNYFRALGRNQRYGISARGLALDAGMEGVAEEFPDFVEFWLGKPKPESTGLTIYALMDSPSVAGAYEFVLKPGETTRIDVTVTLFYRDVSRDIGLAPLTSMYWYGENHEHRFGDYRPEVHDSDGLLLELSDGRYVWRPLLNTQQLRSVAFGAENPKGFGLLQRDREFEHYEDLHNPYHRTPSLFIRPKGEWGAGAVRLIELPTNNEGMDNVVAYWKPNEKPVPGEPYRYAYEMLWTMETDMELSRNKVVGTRVGHIPQFPDTRRFVVDFAGPLLEAMGDSADPPITAVINSGPNGFVTENECVRNPHTKGWRVLFKLDTDDDNVLPVELTCHLQQGDQILTETWSYLWSP